MNKEDAAEAPQPKESEPVAVVQASTVTASGTCGTNLTWSLADDGVLTISGTGDMSNFTSYSNVPWYPNASAITKVVIENGVTSIGENAFYGCSNLTSVTIPASVTKIGNSAFNGCSSLTSVTIPEGVTSIGNSAFNGCSKLASVELPNSLTKIDYSAFNSCSSLTSVTIPAKVTSISNNVFYDCSSLTSVTIPASVTKIGNSVFNGCTSLTDVTIPASVTSIGRSAFFGCSSLTDVTIPASVTSIGSNVFTGCSSLKRIEVDANNKIYSSDSEGILFDKNKNKIICVPAVFSGDYAIPESVTSIDSNAFNGCTSLTSVTIPAKVTSIGSSAFSGCSSLTSVTIPEGVTTINSNVFYNCTSLASVNIPAKVTSIGRDAFSGCNGLTTVYWNAAKVTSFGTQTKNNVARFQIVFGQTTNHLSKAAFDQLLNMGASAATFAAENLSVTIEAGVAADFLPLSISGQPENREYYISPDGVFYRIMTDAAGNKTALLAYYPAEKPNLSYEVPAEINPDTPVVGVSPYAFLGAKVEALTFANPAQITSLGDFAFFNATALASINGKTTDETVLESFSNLATPHGVLLFENTKIQRTSGGPTKDPLEYGNEDGFQLTIVPPADPKDNIRPAETLPGDALKNLYYTGQGATTRIYISGGAAETDYVARVCVLFDSTQGSLGLKEGHYEPENQSGTKVCDLYVQKVPGQPNCYLLDFRNITADATFSYDITSIYPSPTSPGGTASIWGCILTKEEANQKVMPSVSNYHQLRWETKTDDYTVEKKLVGQATVVGDGKGGAILEQLTWNINLIRGEDNLESYGRNNIESIEFTDTLTLPEGATLSQELVNAITAHTYHTSVTSGSPTTYSFTMPDGRKIIDLTVFNGTGASLSLKDGKLTVHFRVQNKKTTEQIRNVAPTLILHKGFVTMKALTDGTTYQIKNDISADIHYMYSAVKSISASCVSTVEVKEGSLVLSKTVTDAEGLGITGRPMGSTVYFTITASNPGYKAYTNLGSLKDAIPAIYYLSPEQLAALFQADGNHELTVTIDHAAICADGFTPTDVMGMDGKTTGKTSLQNTGKLSGQHNCDTTSKTITLSWVDTNQIQIKVGETEVYNVSPDKDSIQQALNSAGFLVTSKTQYTLVWKLADGKTIPGGSQFQKRFAVTAKDTFMNLTADRDTEYNQTKQYYNFAYAYDKDGNKIGDGATHDQVVFSHEFKLTKSWFFKETDLSKGNAAKTTKLRQGDVLDYFLKVTHHGDGSYDILPLVDRMSGGQALLVPYKLNNTADWAKDLTPRMVDGKQYYLLTAEGTYSHVWTAEGQMADSVTVTKNGTTLIKWYFTKYSGDREEDTIHYQSMVCPGEVLPDALSYTLGNEAWLNDHPTHRLHHQVIGWSGSVFDIDKAIVDNINGIADENSPRSSIVEKGQSVVYCLTLFNTPVGEDGETAPKLTIKGSDMSDILPLSVADARWVKGTNVTLTYGEGCTVENGNNWSVTEADATNQQRIQWSEDFTITFSGRAYIYVTLTYPSGTAWEAYANQYGGQELVNTFKVMNSEVSVTHSLKIQGEVRLQKSVYVSGYNDTMSSTDALFHYSNDTLAKYQVTYYVTLYNGGKTRLYLQDMQDQLPRGFTLLNNTVTAYFSGPTNLPADVFNENRNPATVRLPSIGAITKPEEPKAGETQRITFQFSKGPAGNIQAIDYDETLGLCYLNPGEAILFTYKCYTHEQADTDITATNTIAMPYKDHTGAGVTVDEKAYSKRRNRNSDGGKTFEENNGDCRLQTTAEVAQYGFTGGDGNTQWLTSQVTVTRGQIKPSLTKKLTRATGTSGNLTWVYATETLTWTVTAKNEGIYQMQDYVLTDVMEKPYDFTGEVKYQIDGPDGKTFSLFKITNWASDQVTIQYSKNGSSNGGSSTTLDVGQKTVLEWGDDPSDYHVSLTFSRDKDGNAVMSIRLQGKSVAIPAGGSGVLTLSTKITGTEQPTRQFVNAAYITPMAQEWVGTPSNGSKVQWQTAFDTELRDSVQNSAQVMVATSAGTSSTKAVTQTDKPSKTANSTDETNYILLDNDGKNFDYTLSVMNGTKNPIKELVLIDALPQNGDHSVFNSNLPRYSEFKVDLAADPNFTVTVKLKDGTVKTLTAGQYTIDYAAKTEFGEADWDGHGHGEGWSDTQAAGTRSIRLTIKDDSGELFPEGSTLSLKFTCKVDNTAEGADAAQHGEIAWNRFGYQYKDGETALQAGPLKVGVKIPEMPKLIKKLVDSQGKPIVAAEDESFSFLFYEGQALTGSFETKEALIAALATRKYQEFTLTVPAGKSESEAVYLDLGQPLVEGMPYTLVEISNNSDYVFDSLDGRKTQSITFKFDPTQDETIVCKNMSLAWEAKVLKENEMREPLAGAVFALYSPAGSTYTVPSEYRDLNVPSTLERDEKTWYLCGIASTDADGTARWENLREESYYLVEVKAPDGYHLPKDNAWLLSRKDAAGGVVTKTVTNYTDQILPNTGGMGTPLFYVVGSILLFGAGVLLSTKKRMSVVK